MPAIEQDVVIVGGGHNALVAATLLARAGHSVRVLERSPAVGGAAMSARAFGLDATISRYAYLVSLFPGSLLTDLGLSIEFRRRPVASCTPDAAAALVVTDDAAQTRRSFEDLTGSAAEFECWTQWQRMLACAARAVAPTMLGPLPSAAQVRDRMGEQAWRHLVVSPLGEVVGSVFDSDLVRGLVMTDALIGTFARSDELSLRQNRCFLYHVIGDGTGEWKVPVGGMGAVSRALEAAARGAGACIETDAEVACVDADGQGARVVTSDGASHTAAVVLAAIAPAVLDRLLGRRSVTATAPGAQVKVNMLVSRLPRLRCGVDPAVAFAGTLHINERLTQLDAAYDAATAGLPDPMPCEVYCHTLTDASILGAELRGTGAHTLTLFGLHTPAPLFTADPDAMRREARDRALGSLQSVLAEPFEACLAHDADGVPCLEVHTPHDLQDELAMPHGNIFHGDLSWPWAEDDDDVGQWGVETEIDNVFIAGSGARRGGGVSGIGGHNAAMAAIALLARR